LADFFLAQNAPKSSVARLRSDPLGKLTALSQTTQLDLTVLLLREGRERWGGEGGGDGTHPLWKIPGYTTVVVSLHLVPATQTEDNQRSCIILGNFLEARANSEDVAVRHS